MKHYLKCQQLNIHADGHSDSLVVRKHATYPQCPWLDSGLGPLLHVEPSIFPHYLSASQLTVNKGKVPKKKSSRQNHTGHCQYWVINVTLPSWSNTVLTEARTRPCCPKFRNIKSFQSKISKMSSLIKKKVL